MRVRFGDRPDTPCGATDGEPSINYRLRLPPPSLGAAMTIRRLTVLRAMDPLTPERAGSEGPTPPRALPADLPLDSPVDLPVPASERRKRGDAVPQGPNLPLGELLLAMRSESATVRETAWAACYERYYRVVWTRVLYIVRSIGWLSEADKVAEDVTSEVFVGLPEAARQYREEGRADGWLKHVAVRAALRKKESLTGKWAVKKSAPGEEGVDHVRTGRTYFPFEETADEIVERLDTVEREDLIELRRRREALRNSPDPSKRRWDEFLELYVVGYDFKEIGERMGLTEASARNWLCNIRKHLARPIAPDAKE